MHRNSNTFRILFAVVVLLSLTVGMVSAAPVTKSISYQGKMTDASGTPLTGSYTVLFSLYEVSSGGTALAADTHVVQAAKGLFTTQVTADSQLFDGRALWLGIKVGADAEMTPRQEFRPVPYALSLKPGSWITSNDVSSALNLQNTEKFGIALNISTSNISSKGVSARTTGLNSPAFFAYTSGDTSNGLSIRTDGTGGLGVFAYTTGNESSGLTAFTTGVTSPGVSAITSGLSSPGVSAKTSNSNSLGVSASTTGQYSDGLHAATYGGSSPGVSAITSGSGSTGVLVDTQGVSSPGVFIDTQGGSSTGVSVNTEGDSSDGVYISTDGINSEGVYVSTYGATSEGIYAITSGTSSHAIYANAKGASSYGALVYSNQSSAIYASTSRADNKYGIYTPDYLYAKGTQVPAADVAEYMPVTVDATPGTVLVIGPDGKLMPSTTAYDTRVAGIISTEPGVSLGTREDGNPGEALIAVAGRVPCKVDATFAPIHAGDLLTSSNTPGYAMKATDPKIGTVLGKAMGNLESGTGTIEVLVTLQ
jgi:hypothetical protein